jgi:hypothetical protein
MVSAVICRTITPLQLLSLFEVASEGQVFGWEIALIYHEITTKGSRPVSLSEDKRKFLQCSYAVSLSDSSSRPALRSLGRERLTCIEPDVRTPTDEASCPSVPLQSSFFDLFFNCLSADSSSAFPFFRGIA